MSTGNFMIARVLIKSTNQIALSMQESITDASDEQGFDLSLALLTKCKEINEVLQQLFTLSLIKHP